MARPKKIKNADMLGGIPAPEYQSQEGTPIDGEIVNSFIAPELPYALRRELEEISKNSGLVFDLSRPIEELESICNKANYPPDAWRTRWEK